MTPDLETLWRIQDLDRQLSSVRQRLAAFPERRTAAAARLAAAKGALARAEEGVKARALAKRDAESQAEALVAQERKFQTQLTQVKKNEEYTALLAEIKGAQKKRSDLETFVLEKMEEEGAATAEVARAKAALAEAQAHAAAEEKQIAGEESQVEAAATDLAARRATELAALPLALRARYERVFAGKKGQALAELARDSCAACGSRLPMQTAIEVRRGSAIVECPDCGRLLLHKNESDS